VKKVKNIRKEIWRKGGGLLGGEISIQSVRKKEGEMASLHQQHHGCLGKGKEIVN